MPKRICPTVLDAKTSAWLQERIRDIRALRHLPAILSELDEFRARIEGATITPEQAARKQAIDRVDG